MDPLHIAAICAGSLFALWVLAHLKTSRPDGKLITSHHPYRRIMWYIMPTRNESVVYFDAHINADPLLDYLKDAKDAYGATMTDVVLAACARGLLQTPQMNRFVAGHRLYQRNEALMTFSMKRKKKNAKSKIATVKEAFQLDDTVATLTQRIDAKVNVERSDKKTYADKEFQIFNLLPRPLFRFFFTVFRTLDYYNLMPGSFLKSDPMYTSIFLANLGSVGMGAGYHHLYEYGTASLFIMVGRSEEKAVVVDGEIIMQHVLPMRFSFDERIDDGMTAFMGINIAVAALENPRKYLGCLGEEDHVTLGDPLA